MVLFNHSTRELTAKIVYYGAGLCGKTTNLKLLHERLEKGTAGRLLSLATAQDRTIYFDLLPVELGNIKGYTVRFQLCTVPGQVYYNETRKLVLRGVDGIVFVVDSQWSMLSHNLESFQNLRENLAESDLQLDSFPVVVQYNKRDLPGVLSVDALQESLGFQSYPYVEAVASSGRGVVETFKLISKLTFVDLLRRLQRVPGPEPERAQGPDSGEETVIQSTRRRPSSFAQIAAAPETEKSTADDSWRRVFSRGAQEPAREITYPAAVPSPPPTPAPREAASAASAAPARAPTPTIEAPFDLGSASGLWKRTAVGGEVFGEVAGARARPVLDARFTHAVPELAIVPRPAEVIEAPPLPEVDASLASSPDPFADLSAGPALAEAPADLDPFADPFPAAEAPLFIAEPEPILTESAVGSNPTLPVLGDAREKAAIEDAGVTTEISLPPVYDWREGGLDETPAVAAEETPETSETFDMTETPEPQPSAIAGGLTPETPVAEAWVAEPATDLAAAFAPAEAGAFDAPLGGPSPSDETLFPLREELAGLTARVASLDEEARAGLVLLAERLAAIDAELTRSSEDAASKGALAELKRSVEAQAAAGRDALESHAAALRSELAGAHERASSVHATREQLDVLRGELTEADVRVAALVARAVDGSSLDAARREVDGALTALRAEIAAVRDASGRDIAESRDTLRAEVRRIEAAVAETREQMQSLGSELEGRTRALREVLDGLPAKLSEEIGSVRLDVRREIERTDGEQRGVADRIGQLELLHGASRSRLEEIETHQRGSFEKIRQIEALHGGSHERLLGLDDGHRKAAERLGVVESGLLHLSSSSDDARQRGEERLARLDERAGAAEGRASAAEERAAAAEARAAAADERSRKLQAALRRVIDEMEGS